MPLYALCAGPDEMPLYALCGSPDEMPLYAVCGISSGSLLLSKYPFRGFGSTTG